MDACGRNDGTDAITQDSLFHDAIVRGAHNEYVEEFSHTMILHIQRIKYHYFHCDRLRKISVSQHGEILQTIQARDSARAKELMRSHWLCSMENSLRDVAGMIHGVGGGIRTGCSDKVKMGRESTERGRGENSGSSRCFLGEFHKIVSGLWYVP